MDYDVWHSLLKVPQDIVDEINKNPDDRLPDGIVTDGYGKFYKLPKSGSTPLRQLDDNYYVKFRYVWSSNEIEIFILENEEIYDGADGKTAVLPTYTYLDSYAVSAEDFVDNPEYWYRKAYDELEAEIDVNDIQIEEAVKNIEIFNEDDEYEYEYLMSGYINRFYLSNDDWWSEAIEDIEDKLSDYEEYPEYYGRKIKITASLANAEYVFVNVTSPVELDERDLEEIYDDVKFYVEELSSSNDHFYYDIIIDNIPDIH